MAQGEEGSWIVQYKLNSRGAFESVGTVNASNLLEALEKALALLIKKHPELSQETAGLGLHVRPGR